jgi:Putative Flp pilus-assembly TadE/G-like
MLYSRPSCSRRRRGITIPAVALLLTGLLGITALAIDGGLLLSDRRRAQAAADAAALAAAIDLYGNFTSQFGVDTGGIAAISAAKTATDNGFTNGVNGTSVTINIPPLSGPYKGLPGYAEVLITMQQKRYFSSIFGSGDMPVSVRAVAQGSKTARNNGVIILDPTGSNDVTATASGDVTIRGGDLIVDSSDPKGGTTSSTGNIIADNIYFTGNPGYYSSNTGTFEAANGKIYSNQAPTPDPLKNLPPPPQPTTVFKNVNISGLPKVGGAVPGWPDPDNPLNGWVLPAGTYSGGIHISDNNSAHTYTLQSGIFYFTGGGFTLSANAAVKSEPDGVLMYFNSGGGLSLTAGGPVTLSPLQSGTYANITVYEDRSNTSQNSITGQTGGSLNISGTFYSPAAKVTVTGSGADYTIGSQYIVYQLSVTGKGNFLVDYTPLRAPPNRNLYLVE